MSGPVREEVGERTAVTWPPYWEPGLSLSVMDCYTGPSVYVSISNVLCYRPRLPGCLSCLTDVTVFIQLQRHVLHAYVSVVSHYGGFHLNNAIDALKLGLLTLLNIGSDKYCFGQSTTSRLIFSCRYSRCVSLETSSGLSTVEGWFSQKGRLNK